MTYKRTGLALAACLSGMLLAQGVIADDDRQGRDHGDRQHKGDGFEFALIGDTPYGLLPGDDSSPVAVRFRNVVEDINAHRGLKWVLHAGDIKAGSTPCSDEMFEDRLGKYNGFRFPFIMTPGDNEWTDCHRANNGSYLPLERLAKLREVFWPVPGITLGGKPMPVESQALQGNPEFPENVLWTRDDVVFAAIHIVGSNNAEAPFNTRTAADDAEVARRNAAAVQWLDAAFSRAVQLDAPGVFIMIHGNPDLETGLVIGDPFVPFLSALEAHVSAYGKPVVLAHGDSHYFRIDKPGLVADNFLPGFTRVETFGSANYHWVRVVVDPGSSEVFSFHQEIIEANP